MALLISPLDTIGHQVFRVQGYEVRNILGSGKFSLVFSGISNQTIIERPYGSDDIVVKLFQPHQEDHRFTEVTAVRILWENEHIRPNIPEILDGTLFATTISSRNRYPCIVLGPIAKKIQPLYGGIRTVGRLFVPIVDVLSTAHSKGIYHRDVKPDNILSYGNDHDEQILILNDWSSCYIGEPNNQVISRSTFSRVISRIIHHRIE